MVGLEGALIDRSPHVIRALEPADTRSYRVNVAGPGALLVAKLIKVGERTEARGRRVDKDALDILRLLRAVPTAEFAGRIERLLGDARSRDVARNALGLLAELFGTERSAGSRMAARAAQPLEPADVIAASTAALAQDLMAAVGRER